MSLQVKLCCVFVIVQLSACSGSGPHYTTENEWGSETSPREPPLLAENQLAVLQADLLDQYNEWRGAPYRLGGLDKQGIDCSGFVHVTYLSKWGVSLPRTTEFQVNLGGLVSKSELQTGDLVFFKISWRTRHVGIYLRDNQFLHASKSRGVMISDLNNPYWRDHYWKSKRLGKLRP